MTEQQVKAFAVEWYGLLDAHAPVLKLIRRAAEDLVVAFPGKSLTLEDYTEWYSRDIRSNFNGRHEIHSIRVELREDHALVFMELTWTAESWAPPAARSERICLKPNVTLTVVPGGDHGLLLKRYAVTDRED